MNNRNSVENLKSKIEDSLNYLQNCNIQVTNTIKIVLSQFKKRIDVLHTNMLSLPLEDDIPEIIPHYTQSSVNEYKRMRMTNSPLTPSQGIASVQIMRSQAGNYASLSRGLSEVYSQTPSKQ